MSSVLLVSLAETQLILAGIQAPAGLFMRSALLRVPP
jgi:hypothetical protein